MGQNIESDKNNIQDINHSQSSTMTTTQNNNNKDLNYQLSKEGIEFYRDIVVKSDCHRA